MDLITLNNGVDMPALGYGVYQIPASICERCVTDAISVGYRAIDTAQCYGNEHSVGEAIQNSGIDRQDFFVTTKVWTNGYASTAKSINESLRQLKSDYVDLLLIHQPSHDNVGTYKALEEAYTSGKARAIGLSNFYADDFFDVINNCNIIPAVNQLETHVFWQQQSMRKKHAMYNIKLESWAPFAEGMKNMFSNETLVRLGNKYNKTVAQIILRFFIQNDVIVIPKSTHKERMKENFTIFDFKLHNEDMEIISDLDKDKTLFFWP